MKDEGGKEIQGGNTKKEKMSEIEKKSLDFDMDGKL